MPMPKLSAEILNAAIDGFEAQKQRIDAQIAEIRQMLDGGRAATAATRGGPVGRRRKMSAAARKRISDAQRKRWAESRRSSEATSQSTAPPELPKRKRKRRLSAAGKAAIVAALKKRWAAKKAAGVKPIPAVPKKSAARKGTKNRSTSAKTARRKAVATRAAKAPAKRTAAKNPQNASNVPEHAVAEIAGQ